MTTTVTICVRPIRTEADYEATLAEVASLMAAEPGSADEARLDVLATLVEAYEAKHHPVDPPDPIDAILFRMEQSGLAQKDLLPYIGSRARVSEILNRKRHLTLPMIRALEDGLGIPASILVQRYELDASALRVVPETPRRASPRAAKKAAAKNATPRVSLQVAGAAATKPGSVRAGHARPAAAAKRGKATTGRRNGR